MGFEVTRVYKEHFPALRLIGKRYTNADRVNGLFSSKWGEWDQNDWYAELQKLGPSDAVDNGVLGLMTCRSDHQETGRDEFTYWIGWLFPAGTAVPDGFDHLDLPESDVGMTWVLGDDRTGEIYGHDPHTASYHKLTEQGWNRLRENAGGEKTLVFFERYNGQRYTTRDEQGKVTLDYGFYIE